MSAPTAPRRTPPAPGPMRACARANRGRRADRVPAAPARPAALGAVGALAGFGPADLDREAPRLYGCRVEGPSVWRATLVAGWLARNGRAAERRAA